MGWHEFDIEVAEDKLQRAAKRVDYLRAGGRLHKAEGRALEAQHKDLETAVDWYHRFAELDLTLIEG